MTWVVGTPTPFGYAAAIADIQVTWPDGRTLDCLQKVHRVGPSLALGFSGSVKLGFAMCESLVNSLHGGLPSRHDWLPGLVAENWHPEAADIFAAAEPDELRLGCSLLLLGVHPTEDVGVPGWARAYVFRMRAPDFSPEAHGLGAVAIGSGNNVEAYTAKLADITADETRFQYMQAQIMGPFGYAEAILSTLGRAIEANPTTGISPHLHMVLVTRQDVRIGKDDYRVVTPAQRSFTMPPVATTWGEYQRIVGGSAGGVPKPDAAPFSVDLTWARSAAQAHNLDLHAANL